MVNQLKIRLVPMADVLLCHWIQSRGIRVETLMRLHSVGGQSAFRWKPKLLLEALEIHGGGDWSSRSTECRSFGNQGRAGCAANPCSGFLRVLFPSCS